MQPQSTASTPATRTVAARFHFLQPLTLTDIHWICATATARVCNVLQRRGLLRNRADGNHGAIRLASCTAIDTWRQAALSRGRFERLDVRGRFQQQLFPVDPTFLCNDPPNDWRRLPLRLRSGPGIASCFRPLIPTSAAYYTAPQVGIHTFTCRRPRSPSVLVARWRGTWDRSQSSSGSWA